MHALAIDNDGMSDELKDEISRYKTVMMMAGVLDDDAKETLDKLIKKHWKEFKRAAKKGERSFEDLDILSEIFVDDKLSLEIASLLKNYDAGSLYNIPDGKVLPELREYFQKKYNHNVKSFYNDSLPEIHRLLGIGKNKYNSVPIRVLDNLPVMIDSYMSSHKEYFSDDFKYISNLIKVHIASEAAEESKQRTNKGRRVEGHAKMDSDYSIKGVNILFHLLQNLDELKRDASTPLGYSEKSKDVNRLASKIRELLLKLIKADTDDKEKGIVDYETALKNIAKRRKNKKDLPEISIADIAGEMKTSYASVLTTDNNGALFIHTEGQEERYNQLFKGNRFILLSKKTESSLEGIKKARDEKYNIFPKEYDSRFKHTRLKVYDTVTKGIIDLHFTNWLSYNIKDYCPGISPSQRSAGVEKELDERHESSRPSFLKIADFLYESERQRKKVEAEFHRRKFEKRSDYILRTLRGEISKVFRTKEQKETLEEVVKDFDKWERKSGNVPSEERLMKKIFADLDYVDITKEKLEKVGTNSKLSFVIDWLYFQIRNILLAKKADFLFEKTDSVYSLNESNPLKLKQLVEYSDYAIYTHKLLFGNTSEEKEWKNRKADLKSMNNYLSYTMSVMSNIEGILSSAFENKSSSYVTYQNLKKAVTKYAEFSNKALNKQALKKVHNQIQVRLMSSILSEYSKLNNNLPKTQDSVPKTLREYLEIFQHQSEFYTYFSAQFKNINGKNLMPEDIESYRIANDKFLESYNYLQGRINTLGRKMEYLTKHRRVITTK